MRVVIPIAVLKLFCVALVGATIGVLGLLAGAPMPLVFGLAFLAGWVLGMPQTPRCSGGSVSWRVSESGEIHLGTCQDCGRWELVVRGTLVGGGRGLDAFVETAENIARTYDRAVPQIALELRQVVEQLEGGAPKIS